MVLSSWGQRRLKVVAATPDGRQRQDSVPFRELRRQKERLVSFSLVWKGDKVLQVHTTDD